MFAKNQLMIHLILLCWWAEIQINDTQNFCLILFKELGPNTYLRENKDSTDFRPKIDVRLFLSTGAKLHSMEYSASSGGA